MPPVANVFVPVRVTRLKHNVRVYTDFPFVKTPMAGAILRMIVKTVPLDLFPIAEPPATKAGHWEIVITMVAANVLKTLARQVIQQKPPLAKMDINSAPAVQAATPVIVRVINV